MNECRCGYSNGLFHLPDKLGPFNYQHDSFFLSGIIDRFSRIDRYYFLRGIAQDKEKAIPASGCLNHNDHHHL
ncbi:MAG: hypothetical protein HQ482_02545 [Sphingomonadales bacterium]|nr:hypothetical protein [Sphingomonadales bacterium]